MSAETAQRPPLLNTPPATGRDFPETDFGKPIKLGLLVLVIGFFGFFIWAAFAPLDEGVPANGIVSVESKRKRVDHLTGGIIEKILVREGDQVKAGQELIQFNEVQAKAALNATLNQWRNASATESRLQAERAGLKSITFDEELARHSTDPEVATIVKTQNELLRARRAALKGELAIVRESVRGLEFQLRSLEQLKIGREKQLRLFNEQLDSFIRLHSQGFVSRNQLLTVEGQLAELQSKQSEDLADIAGINARMAEFRMRGAQVDIAYRRDIEGQLAEAQKNVSTFAERLISLRDTHERLMVRAPVDGIVVDLAFHTAGSTIKPGDRILDIVPAGDALIVETRILPQYIDRIHAGLPADLHFDAYMARAERPVVRGEVILVSADSLVEPRTGEQYYSARVAVSPAEMQKLGNLLLQPGMQATVMIKTGERSLLTYLMRPFLRRFTSAMRES